MEYGGFTHWNMVILCFWVFFAGRYVSVWGFVKSWLPSCLIVGAILLFKHMSAS